MPRDYSNKLSIYLIKKEYATDKDILKDAQNLTAESISDVGMLYYGKSKTFAPAWLKKFFGNVFDNRINSNENLLKIFSASAKALLLVRIKGRIFAISFGYGRNFLKPGVCEERFGLKTLANIINPEKIRIIDKKNMSIVPKIATEQMTVIGSMSDFGVDIEQDLLQGMTGVPISEEFGKSVTGKDALSLSVKINIRNIKDLLLLCYEKYNSNEYKNNFDWIDHIAEIKSPQIIKDLDNQLIESIKSLAFDKNKIWMAIPDIVPWESVLEFRMESNQVSLGDDILIKKFIDSLDQDASSDLSLEAFKKENIECISAENEEIINSWRAYDCIYSEITKEGRTYILSNGNWYEIEVNFAKTINENFNNILSEKPAIVLPESERGEHEDKYNKRIANEIPGVCCLDRKIINYGGSYSKIEFCDLLSANKKIIHVKRYGSSSVLSHLFSQGLVSGDLFLSDIEFRKKVKKMVPASHKDLIPMDSPDPKAYTIIFAVVSKMGRLSDIPFFSKVNLRNTIKRLSGSFKYNVSFVVVNTKPKKDDEQ